MKSTSFFSSIVESDDAIKIPSFITVVCFRIIAPVSPCRR